jgi:hypothetical protein
MLSEMKKKSLNVKGRKKLTETTIRKGLRHNEES